MANGRSGGSVVCGLRPASCVGLTRGYSEEEEEEEREEWLPVSGKGEENPEFRAQVSSAVLRYFYRQTRRFNRDSRYFTRARANAEHVNIFDLQLLYGMGEGAGMSTNFEISRSFFQMLKHHRLDCNEIENLNVAMSRSASRCIALRARFDILFSRIRAQGCS